MEIKFMRFDLNTNIKQRHQNRKPKHTNLVNITTIRSIQNKFNIKQLLHKYET